MARHRRRPGCALRSLRPEQDARRRLRRAGCPLDPGSAPPDRLPCTAGRLPEAVTSWERTARNGMRETISVCVSARFRGIAAVRPDSGRIGRVLNGAAKRRSASAAKAAPERARDRGVRSTHVRARQHEEVAEALPAGVAAAADLSERGVCRAGYLRLDRDAPSQRVGGHRLRGGRGASRCFVFPEGRFVQVPGCCRSGSGRPDPPPEQVLTNLACAPAASVDFPLDLVQTVEYSKRAFRA